MKKAIVVLSSLIFWACSKEKKAFNIELYKVICDTSYGDRVSRCGKAIFLFKALSSKDTVIFSVDSTIFHFENLSQRFADNIPNNNTIRENKYFYDLITISTDRALINRTLSTDSLSPFFFKFDGKYKRIKKSETFDVMQGSLFTVDDVGAIVKKEMINDKNVKK